MEEILINNLKHPPMSTTLKCRLINASFFHLSKEEFWYCETCNKIKDFKEFRCITCGRHKKELELVKK